ncbi:hypothetical protein B0J18DRAFT_427669 [Chaetomium sp. MPI-SDFR-AT-0129]|nr:hypothetical protein B0J18DRAFT_427669 [Chaetomium sp. MPI-SDFR-AT-0129]
MPARGRSPAPSLPPVADDDAAAPFSEIYKAPIDSTTPEDTTAFAELTDRSIFVTANGIRYRLERIDDEDGYLAPAQLHHRSRGRVPTSPSSSFSGQIHPPSPSAAQPATQPNASYTSSPNVSGTSISYSGQQPHLHAPPHNSAGWGRSSSNASSYSRSSGAHSMYSIQSGYATAASTIAVPPRPGYPRRAGSFTQDAVADNMAQLNLNGFGANTFYGESDGGAHTAEALTDPSLGPMPPMSPIRRHTDGLSQGTASPAISYVTAVQYEQQSVSPPVVSASWELPTSYASPPWTSVNYPSYTTQSSKLVQESLQQATAKTGLPSLVEGATLISHPPVSVEASPDPSSLSLSAPHKEVLDERMMRHGSYPLLHHSISAPASHSGQNSTWVNIGHGEIDTQTPVVIPEPAHSTSGDTTSIGRDNVFPGEDLLFDGPVKSARTLAPEAFKEGVLKVFRHNITNDLRFYCTVVNEAETFRIKANNAQLVPVYAYDQRLLNVVYIRDGESNNGAGYRPSWIYQFSSLRALFDFQACLTGEKVVLDIGSVRMVTINKANVFTNTQYSSARLQIWHEAEGRRNAQSDVASFVTAGTALSGPLRERVTVSSSRLMLYLGRTEEYLTLFITDDLEVKAESQTIVKIRPRKGSIRRWQSVKAHHVPKRGTEPAGLDIHGRVVEVDVESAYDSYRTIKIEFENSQSQDVFLRKWEEVMRERRLQRMRVADYRDRMNQAVFPGHVAMGVFM